MHAAAPGLSSRIARLAARWGFSPAPDSAVADAIRRGKSPWVDTIHLLWSLWVFITPLLGGRYSIKWVALTAITYPLFLVLYAKTLLSPRRVAHRYALAMTMLCLVLLQWYPSGIRYFVFGCVLLHVGRRASVAAYLPQWALLNAAFLLVTWQIGYPPAAMLWVPVMTLIIGVI